MKTLFITLKNMLTILWLKAKTKQWFDYFTSAVFVIIWTRRFEKIIVKPEIKKGLNTSNFEQVSESLKDEVSNIAQSENLEKIGEILYTVDNSQALSAFGIALVGLILICDVYGQKI